MNSVHIIKLICFVYVLVMWYFLYADNNIIKNHIDFSECSDEFLYFQLEDFFDLFQDIRTKNIRKMKQERAIEICSQVIS